MVSTKFWSLITFGLGKESPQSKAAAAHASTIKNSKKTLCDLLDKNIASLAEYLEVCAPEEEEGEHHDPDSLDTQDDADLTLLSEVDGTAAGLPKTATLASISKLFSQTDLARLLKAVHYYQFYLMQRVRAGKATPDERNLIPYLAGGDNGSTVKFVERVQEVHTKIQRTDIMSPMLAVHYSELLNMLSLLREDISR